MRAMSIPVRSVYAQDACNPIRWYEVRESQGVEAVLGVDGRPMPLSIDEAKALNEIIEADLNLAFDFTERGRLHQKEIGRTKKETARMIFKPGTRVTVQRGPFTSYPAEVEEVTSSGKVQALVQIFGSFSNRGVTRLADR